MDFFNFLLFLGKGISNSSYFVKRIVQYSRRRERVKITPYLHCPKNYLNLRTKTKPVMAGADAPVHGLVFGQNQIYMYFCTVCSTTEYMCEQNWIFTVAYALDKTGSVFILRL